ncbi:MAG: hypothetical protein EAZ92_05145 [Candidatus Kapaibacterium sp.]|nr:MAG: hypothetical protein EAZ92_05145 [Candidatus Kapabacteria bacterium]
MKTNISSSNAVLMHLAASSFVATLLAALAVAGWFSQERELARLSEQITLTVFCTNTATNKEISALQTELAVIRGIDSVQVKAATDIKNEFVSRFATSLSASLGTNPFPNALIVHLKPDARTTDRIDTIAAEVRSLRGVSDIAYRAAFVSLVEARSREASIIRRVAGAVVVVVLIMMLWNALQAVDIVASGLQRVALGVCIGAALGGLAAILLYFALRSSVLSLDSVRPVSLLAGSAIVCALGGIALVVRAVILVKNTPASPAMSAPTVDTSTATHSE